MGRTHWLKQPVQLRAISESSGLKSETPTSMRTKESDCGDSYVNVGPPHAHTGKQTHTPQTHTYKIDKLSQNWNHVDK